MKQTGYLIANSLSKGTFFTSSSAYDKPKWVGVNEATKYVTAEIAESALKKLLKNGIYAVRLVPIQEALSFEFPDEKPLAQRDRAELPPADIEAPIDDEGMEARDQEDVCPDCSHEPCTCDLGDDGEIDSRDIPMDHEEQLRDEVFGREEEENANVANRFDQGQTVTYKGNEYIVVGDAGNGISVISATNDPTARQRVSNHDLLPVHESAELPAKPAADAAPTITNEPVTKVEKIKYKDPSHTDAPFTMGGDSDDTKVAVPSDVSSELSKAIAEFDKTADEQNGRDDARASFCMTTADAMRDLQALLSVGTVAGIKQAQIKLSTMMNPITSNIPASVLKFIHMGGRKPTLKDLFDNKRQEQKDATK